MKFIKTSVVAAAFALAGAIGGAGAQDSTPPQTPPGDGYTMGPWMMGPGGMMNNGATGPYMMGQYGGMPMMGWGGRGAAMCNLMSSHIDGRLAYQKAELKITAAQESLWNAYAKAAHENADAMTAHCTAMMDNGGAKALSLPDRLEQHETFMETQIDAMKTLNKTVKPLYATFSDAQKKAADQMIWGPMGMM